MPAADWPAITTRPSLWSATADQFTHAPRQNTVHARDHRNNPRNQLVLELAGNTTLAGTTPTFGGTVNGAANDLTLSFSGTTAIDGAKLTNVRNLSSSGATTLTGALTTAGTRLSPIA